MLFDDLVDVLDLALRKACLWPQIEIDAVEDIFLVFWVFKVGVNELPILLVPSVDALQNAVEASLLEKWYEFSNIRWLVHRQQILGAELSILSQVLSRVF